MLGLPLGTKDVAFGAGAAGFERSRYDEGCVLYSIVWRADPFAARAEVELAAVRCATWCDGATDALRLAVAGVGQEVGDFANLIKVKEG